MVSRISAVERSVLGLATVSCDIQRSFHKPLFWLPPFFALPSLFDFFVVHTFLYFRIFFPKKNVMLEMFRGRFDSGFFRMFRRLLWLPVLIVFVPKPGIFRLDKFCGRRIIVRCFFPWFPLSFRR